MEYPIYTYAYVYEYKYRKRLFRIFSLISKYIRRKSFFKDVHTFHRPLVHCPRTLNSIPPTREVVLDVAGVSLLPWRDPIRNPLAFCAPVLVLRIIKHRENLLMRDLNIERNNDKKMGFIFHFFFNCGIRATIM